MTKVNVEKTITKAKKDKKRASKEPMDDEEIGELMELIQSENDGTPKKKKDKGDTTSKLSLETVMETILKNQATIAQGIYNRLDERDEQVKEEMKEVRNELRNLQQELQRSKEDMKKLTTRTDMIERKVESGNTVVTGMLESGELTEEMLIETNIRLAKEIEEEQRHEQIEEFRKIPRGIREENRRKAAEKVRMETKEWNAAVENNRAEMVRQLQEFRDRSLKEMEEEERRGGFMNNRNFEQSRRMVPVPLYVKIPRKPYRKVKDLLFGTMKIPSRNIIAMSWVNGFTLEILMEKRTREQIEDLLRDAGIQAGRKQGPEDETAIRKTERLRDLIRHTRNASAKHWYMATL